MVLAELAFLLSDYLIHFALLFLEPNGDCVPSLGP
jgi:hypothetical protein